MSWISATNHPGDFDSVGLSALEGGYDKDGVKLYVGRASLEGGIHLGYIHSKKNVCSIPLFEKEHIVRKFEALSVPAGVNVQWVSCSNGSIPPDAVQGGQNELKQMTYVGRAEHKHAVLCGEVVPSEGCCYVSYNGKEHEYKDYQVLAINGLSVQAVGSASAAQYTAHLIKWQDVSGKLNPTHLQVFGAGHASDGSELYVARSVLSGGRHVSYGCHVGAVRAGQVASIPLYGVEQHPTNYQVLTVPPDVPLHWVKASNGNVPPNAVEGGYDKDGSKTYIGRITHGEDVTPGEIVPDKKVLYIAHKGMEKQYEHYEVLVMTSPGATGGLAAGIVAPIGFEQSSQPPPPFSAAPPPHMAIPPVGPPPPFSDAPPPHMAIPPVGPYESPPPYSPPLTTPNAAPPPYTDEAPPPYPGN